MKWFLLSFCLFVVDRVVGQTETHDLVYTSWHAGLIRNDFVETRLTISRVDSVVTYTYTDTTGSSVHTINLATRKFILPADSRLMKNLGNTPVKTNKQLGNIYRWSGGIKPEPVKYDTLENGLISMSGGTAPMDTGFGGLFCEQIGIVLEKGHRCNCGKVLYSVDGEVIAELVRYGWIHK